MEFVQFHPTGMVWPLSVRGLLVTESVRGDGGVLRNSLGERFMFNYVPDMFRAETADSEEEGDKWYEDHNAGRRPPELLPRDEVARAINSEVKAGRGSPHGGVFLDIASRRTPEYIRRRLPSMYHQFMELAGVDITREAMEIGPTCHYIMGGVQVDADSEETVVPGLFAAGEVGGGMHGANRLGGNSLSDLIVFGKRAGAGAADYVASGNAATSYSQAEVDDAIADALAPLSRENGENPYDVQHDLQEMMQSLVGIIRTASELEEAAKQLDRFTERVKHISVKGGRAYNPGWNLATDLPAMISVSKCVTLGATLRKESRGGHTREDFPAADPELGKINFAQTTDGGNWDSPVSVVESPILVMPDELKVLLEEAK
jgi:succinate dehydrogenase / fumarate reductase flavoprotein subunit